MKFLREYLSLCRIMVMEQLVDAEGSEALKLSGEARGLKKLLRAIEEEPRKKLDKQQVIDSMRD